MSKIELCNGKYTIINDLENGEGFKALRYGQEWRSLDGDNLVLALFTEVEDLNERIEQLQKEKSNLNYEIGAYSGKINLIAKRLFDLEKEMLNS